MVERKFFDVGAVTVGATVLSLIVASRLLLRKRFAVHKKGIIVVTGASSGIGWHTAVYFVRKGYVVLAGVRKNADYDAVEQLEMDNLKPVKLDVTDHSSCVNAINVIKKVSLQMDIPFIGLVNNAGISRVAACEYHDLEDIRSVFATNLFGAIEMTQLAMPLLRESKGRVIMISSIFGKYGMYGCGAYSASKFALEGFSDALRREVEPFGVSVSLVEPGKVKTSLLQDVCQNMEYYTYPRITDHDRLVYTMYTENGKDKIRAFTSDASSPEDTVGAIYHAMTGNHPHTRYVTATIFGSIHASYFLSALWLLPDRLVDYFLQL